MLAEGFLRVLRYREERKFISAFRRKRSQTPADCEDSFKNFLSNTNSADPQTHSTEADPNQGEVDHTQCQESGKDLKVAPQGSVGLSIPGCTPVLALDHDFLVCLDDCSLLEQYPDLQVADSSGISHNALRAVIAQHGLYPEVYRQPDQTAQNEPHGELYPAEPDQGYLVMGPSMNISLDLPGSGLEPMSNSVLNGLLDRQLEEVYMQHLTDNLARCHSHLGNSLLHDLVPPPQPSSHSQGPISLEASLEDGSEGGRGKKISYLSTQHTVPCSSNFSSPVLRISDIDNSHLQ